MGIRKYRGQIVCDKHWPDGTRTIRVCPNRTQAKQLLDRINASVADGSWREFKSQLALRGRGFVTLRAYSQTYLEEYAQSRNKRSSVNRKRIAIRFLNQFMGQLELEFVTPAQAHKYIQHRKSQGLSGATINRELTILKHLLAYATECGIIDSNPLDRFKKLREDQKERPRFTDSEVESVIQAARSECRPVFRFLRETGCRREEALSLQRWQVQEAARLVVFSEDTKSGKYRYVPLTETALEAVNSLPRLTDSPTVFYNTKTGQRWYDCKGPWIEARERAGLPQIQVKDLRRHFAIGLAENGADMHDIQQVLGHASVATTERYYAQFSPKHSAKKILKVLEGGQSKRAAETVSEPETKRKQAQPSLLKVGEGK